MHPAILTIRRPSTHPNRPDGLRGDTVFHGKLKILGNFELRSDILIVRMAGKDYALGVAAFFDAGRVCAEWQPSPERPIHDRRRAFAASKQRGDDPSAGWLGPSQG